MKLRNDFKNFNWYNLIHNAGWTTQVRIFSTIDSHERIHFSLRTHTLGTALSISIIRIKTYKFCHVPWILFIEIFSMEFMSNDVILISLKFSLLFSLHLSPFSNVIKMTITGKIFHDESMPTWHKRTKYGMLVQPENQAVFRLSIKCLYFFKLVLCTSRVKIYIYPSTLNPLL